MNRETLERLVIDRAMGELSPDAAELLEAHLQSDSRAASEAGRIGETLLLAKQALVQTRLPALPLPAFDPQVLAFPKTPKQRLLPLQWFSAMAACAVAGLFLGLFLSRDAGLRPAAQPVAASQTLALPASGEPGESSFWSVQRLRSRRPVAPAAANARVMWKSPVRMPEIESSL